MDLDTRLRQRLLQQVLKARRDPVEYISFTGRVEGNKPVQMTPVHREWHEILDDHNRVVLFAPVNHGKTSQITRWRLLYEIGRNPNIRIAVISSSERLPGKILGAIKAEILQNPWLRVVFPHLRPSQGAQKAWGGHVIVERTDNVPDPTIQIFGLYGKILGSRLDLVILDDICTFENTLGKWNRDKAYDWVSGEVLSRLDRKGGRVWALGHVWHEDDVLHRLSRLSTFKTFKYKAIIGDERTGRRPLIPEMWTLEGLDHKAEELTPIFAKMMLQNELADVREGRIRRGWFEKCLQRGIGYDLLDYWNPNDAPTYTGVDLGVRTEGAVTCMFTVAVLPDGTRWLIDIRSGHWAGPEILRQLSDVHTRFGSIISVENNAAQDFILQFASEVSTLPIKGHNTGANKHHPQFGVESIGLELSQGKWRLPCDENLVPPKEVAEWIKECVAYSPDSHMGDRLSASWICREAIRQSPASNLRRGYADIDTLIR